MKLKLEELDALHECLTWLRQPGNNPLNFYGEELENFDRACRVLMDQIKHVLPEAMLEKRTHHLHIDSTSGLYIFFLFTGLDTSKNPSNNQNHERSP